jgi:hypothetical protein
MCSSCLGCSYHHCSPWTLRMNAVSLLIGQSDASLLPLPPLGLTILLKPYQDLWCQPHFRRSGHARQAIQGPVGRQQSPAGRRRAREREHGGWGMQSAGGHGCHVLPLAQG